MVFIFSILVFVDGYTWETGFLSYLSFFHRVLCRKQLVFSMLRESRGLALRRKLLCTRVIVNDPPSHRKPMKNQRKYAPRIAHCPFQVPVAENQGGIGSERADFEVCEF